MLLPLFGISLLVVLLLDQLVLRRVPRPAGWFFNTRPSLSGVTDGRATTPHEQPTTRDLASRWSSGDARVAPRRRRSPRSRPGAEELGIAEWDGYGDGGAVDRLEEEVAALLGTRGRGLLRQRRDGPAGGAARLVRPRRLAPGRACPTCRTCSPTRTTARGCCTASTSSTSPPAATRRRRHTWRRGARRLGAALVELPLRDAGCLLPTLGGAGALSAPPASAAYPCTSTGPGSGRSQPFYDAPLAELAGLADSVYVSFYKGLGALPGAAVAGDAAFVDEVRVWRRRMGGTLLPAHAVAAERARRPARPAAADGASTHAWARAFAAELVARGLRPHPAPPHTSVFEVYADRPAADVNERLLALVERTGIAVAPAWRPGEMPGTAVCEVSCYSRVLDHDPAQVADWFAEVAAPVGRCPCQPSTAIPSATAPPVATSCGSATSGPAPTVARTRAARAARASSGTGSSPCSCSSLKPAIGTIDVLLDVAPSPQTSEILASLRPGRHVKLDLGLDGRRVDVLASLTELPLGDAAVDLLFATTCSSTSPTTGRRCARSRAC